MLSAILLGLVLITLQTVLQSFSPPRTCLESMDQISRSHWGGKQRTAQSRSSPSTGGHWELKNKLKAEGIHPNVSGVNK